MPDLAELTIDQVPGIASGFMEAMSRVADVYAEREDYKGDVFSVVVTAKVEVRMTKLGTASVHGLVTTKEPNKKTHGKPAHITGGAVFVEPEPEQENLFAIPSNE
jgi:hypothetical protein